MSCECPTWGERIDHVLDGELSPEEEALFRGHLAGCDTCRRELEQERQLSVEDHIGFQVREIITLRQ